MLTESQKAAFTFLLLRAKDGKAFTVADIEKVVGWQKGSFTTYRTKHLKGYLVATKRGKTSEFTIKPHFRRLTEEEFQEIVTQSRKTVAQFGRTVYEAVLRYEFLLPLTNERKLRTALDALFYRDHLEQRAREIGVDTLSTLIPKEAREGDETYFARVGEKVGSLLGGYSIGHVFGRFRATSLRTHVEAAEVLAKRGRYLVDETTAVVRFLLPLQGSRREHGKQFDVTKLPSSPNGSYVAEVDTARRLFIAFFVESVILDIHGEDEIWFLESSPSGERLYVLDKEAPKPPPQASVAQRQIQLPIPTPLDMWLRDNGYTSIAKKIVKIEGDWKAKALTTRRNWWDVLAGDKKGKPRSVAGVEFPIIASIRKRQGLGEVFGAKANPGEKPPPAK